MFPNPQSALPLPPRPSLERYRKIAKDLVKACRKASEIGSESGLKADLDDPFLVWAEEWVDALVRLTGLALEPQLSVRVEQWIDGVAEFARRQLAGDKTGERLCALADAQFVIARSHGFESWPKFMHGLEALAHGGSSDASRFEAAADAIVAGDVSTLRRLLDEEPGLIRMRSMREHGATLLHYVSANGVEGYRQRTPKNVAEIAEFLLRAGAEVNATANVYGGNATTLGLTVTSGHPERAGAQEELMRLLLENGARIGDGLVRTCLANGRGRAAEFIAGRAAHLDLDEAAGIGRIDLVEEWVAKDGTLLPGATPKQWSDGFLFACQFGRDAVVELLIRLGVDLAAQDGHGQTGLHQAVIGGHLETVKLLLKHKPPIEAVNAYGGTLLGQALWSAGHGGDAEVYISVLEVLTAAGAKLPERHVPVNDRVDAWLEERGSHAEQGWYWNGERPRSDTRKSSSS
jgi:Ankyrin repeats (3 copies)/Ankyrin repeat